MYTQFSSEYHRPHTERPLMATTTHNSQPHGTDLIGQPIHFASGQFAGKTIRAELREIQQADLGRKYARVDRRPLDPPPVVQLRLFEVYNMSSTQQTEKEIENYDEIQMLGLLCTVDLFPVPPHSTSNNKATTATQHPHSAPALQTTFQPSVSQFPPEQKQVSYTFVPSHTYSAPGHSVVTMPPASPIVAQSSIPGFLPPSSAATDIVHLLGEYPIAEHTKVTQALVGATFVQPSNVEFQGRKSIMFVFADLAVKIEGTFILRYRIFDIFSRPYNHADLAIQAECYGGSFRVYSTKEFPGLQASTELTKQLARWGVRLNTRETERKRRKKGEARSASPLNTPAGKRKLPPSDTADATYGTDND